MLKQGVLNPRIFLIINQHKDKRIDAQYYMKVDKEDQVRKMLQEAKGFVSVFDEIVSNLNEEEICAYRTSLNKISRKA